MIHPATELRLVNTRIGYGVFATTDIPAGTITWVHDRFDQRVSIAEARGLPQILAAALMRFAYRDLDGSYVLCWDHARFNNHSCLPSCRTVGDFDIAVRDIPAGAELSIDYAAINVPEELECECGSAACRGVITGEDAVRFGERWDAEIHSAAVHVLARAQPLATLFNGSATLTRLVEALGRGEDLGLPASRDLVLRTRRAS